MLAGGKLKETTSSHWNSPNTGATNESGFTALPGGYRQNYGFFNSIDASGEWWSSTESSSFLAERNHLYSTSKEIYQNWGNKIDGYSIRCIKSKSPISFQIKSINPNSAQIGDVISILGSGFGSSQSSSFVSFTGTNAQDYISWNSFEIKVKVPIGAKSGKVSVTVNGVKSNEIEFTVVSSDPNEVNIGSQTWMSKNLDVDHYRNGDSIPQVTDSNQWANLTTGAWCYYENQTDNGITYGKLYNWFAINDSRGLAPTGWHIPSEGEGVTLINYLGGPNFAGGKLKEAGTSHWATPNKSATNESGFTALPGGFRDITGNFSNIGNFVDFWFSTEDNVTFAKCFGLTSESGDIILHKRDKASGCAVRCVKD
jgi:uncharacterized protein (TIGR02145 family)